MLSKNLVLSDYQSIYSAENKLDDADNSEQRDANLELIQ